MKPLGFFDLSLPVNSRVTAADVNNGYLAIAAAEPSGGALIVLLDERLSELQRLRINRRVARMAIGTSQIAVLSRVPNGVSICAFEIAEPSKEKCVRIMDQWSSELASQGNSFYTILGPEVRRLDFSTGGYSVVQNSLFRPEGPFVFRRFGKGLIRFDLVKLEGSVCLEDNRPARRIELISPQLKIDAQDRDSREFLATHMLEVSSKGKLEVWLSRSRRNINVGLPLERFDQDGRFLGTVVLKTPAFEDLKRPVNPQTMSGNPTGHLSEAYAFAIGRRVVLVDRDAARIVWFEIPPAL